MSNIKYGKIRKPVYQIVDEGRNAQNKDTLKICVSPINPHGIHYCPNVPFHFVAFVLEVLGSSISKSDIMTWRPADITEI